MRLLALLMSFALVAVAAADDRFDDRVDPDRRRINAAQGRITTAQEKLEDATRRVRETWEADPVYIETRAQLDDLQREIDEARRESNERLREEDPEYLELTQDLAAAEEQMAAIETLEKPGIELEDLPEDVREDLPAGADGETPEPATRPEVGDAGSGGAATGGIPVEIAEEDAGTVDPARYQLAQRKLEIEKAMADREEAAFRARPGMAEKLGRLDSVRLEMTKMQEQLDALLANDSGYRSAQRELAEAQGALQAAGR